MKSKYLASAELCSFAPENFCHWQNEEPVLLLFFLGTVVPFLINSFLWFSNLDNYFHDSLISVNFFVILRHLLLIPRSPHCPHLLISTQESPGRDNVQLQHYCLGLHMTTKQFGCTMINLLKSNFSTITDN